ncbi:MULTISPECIES: hypothetical protein [Sphingobacterium]|uniref:hypothetical protein n=1 Tax=Sphingobacterium TaxID=28453 RepID=UPI0013DBEC97|nr:MULTISPECIES: hypothetical protein [unclassified Sphingobacterium]
MYRFLGIVILLLALLTSCGQRHSEERTTKDSVEVVAPVTVEEKNDLTEVVTRFVRAYVSKDNNKVNRLVHPDLGITIIYRPGASDTFVKLDSIDFAKPMPDYFPYPDFSNDYTLTFEKLPEFDCGTEKWNKLGFFCDTTSHPNQLSNIVAFEKEFDETMFSEEQLEAIEVAEAESFRVIVTTATPLVFHVRRYKGIWYVTTLDRAYAGCDA